MRTTDERRTLSGARSVNAYDQIPPDILYHCTKLYQTNLVWKFYFVTPWESYGALIASSASHCPDSQPSNINKIKNRHAATVDWWFTSKLISTLRSNTTTWYFSFQLIRGVTDRYFKNYPYIHTDIYIYIYGVFAYIYTLCCTADNQRVECRCGQFYTPLYYLLLFHILYLLCLTVLYLIFSQFNVL